MVDFHCPHDGAVLDRAIDFCPVCGEEFTGAVGTAIKQRIENNTVELIVKWIRSRAPHDGANIDNTLADAIERGEWRRKP